MEIPGKAIASLLEKSLKKDIKKARKKLRLTTFLIGESKDQLSFVKIKAKVAKSLGVEFNLVHMKNVPSFEDFMHRLKEKTKDPKTTGIIIQQPLPAQLSTSSLYDYLPDKKEIEGHKKKTPFLPPIGLALLTLFKYIYIGQKINDRLFVNLTKDKLIFKNMFKNKKVVLIGRGMTGGEPVGKTLSQMRINYISINSQTPDPQIYCREADIIITAVGKKVITPDMVKLGAVLINVGLRHERGRIKGDYEEKEVKGIAGFYSPTPGGIGPLDVLYLYKNLLDAAILQR